VVAEGGRRFTQGAFLTCGDLSARRNERWEPIRTQEGPVSDARLHAGVYRTEGQLLAVNRPAGEDDREAIEPARAKELFSGVPVQLFEEKEGAADRKQTEIWRLLLAGMLLFLVVEGILILPERAAAPERAVAPAGASVLKNA